MTNINAMVIADSIDIYDNRLTTMELFYPRIIHAEFMTHRVFSRNASSSRAIPVKRMIDREVFVPNVFGENKSGMQADKFLNWEENEKAREIWLTASRQAASFAYQLAELGVHKQWANRLLEPFSYISVVVSSTEWDNFFNLRDHKDAQPEIRDLAQAMREQLDASTPLLLRHGEWHTPYALPTDLMELTMRLIVSAARCARVSYVGHDGKPTTIQQDIDLFARLITANPPHMSPLEHQATPCKDGNTNFVGWKQQRRFFECPDEPSGIIAKKRTKLESGGPIC